MQISYSSFEQGDIVVLEMRFSNQEESKVRPGLVISSTQYNKHGEDIIVLKITSQTKNRPFDVPLIQNDLIRGKLNLDSFIKADFPIVITKQRILKTIGSVNPKIIEQTKEKLKQVFEL